MDEKTLQILQENLKSVVDEVMEKRLGEALGPVVASETKRIVEEMRLEKALFGKDKTGLTDEKKSDFAKQIKDIANGNFRVKANEAMIEEQDSRGGYLVPKEVANAIVRIAASVGVTMAQAQKWPMATDEKDIPAYTGAFLEGEYLGFDAAGSVTGMTFAQARLIAKKWQLAFVVANDLLSDANVVLADWLLALGGESLANMVDKQAFTGTGAPFVGILNHPDVTVLTLPSGEDTFAEFILDDASDAIASVEESVLDGAAFYFERTVWAKIRMKKDTTGNYVLPQAGAVSNNVLANNPTGGGVKPAGEILGFPVYTIRHLPKNSATAVSTKFAVFGNLKALAYGDKGDLRVMQAQSGAFGGKEIALADQTGLIYKHRHALVVTLPAAFVAIKTAAS